MDAHRRRLECRDACRARCRGGIKRAGDGERHWKDRAHAVNDVEAEEQRNVEARLFDGDTLHAARLVGAVEIEEGSEFSFAHELLAAGVHRWPGLPEASRRLSHLPELFLERHEGKQ